MKGGGRLNRMETLSDNTGTVCAVLWALAAAGMTWYCAVIARQITYITLADGRRQMRMLPLAFRLLLPLAQNFKPLFGRPVFNRAKESVARRLTSAGFEGLLAADEFLALNILMPSIFGLVLWVPFLRIAVEGAPRVLGAAAPVLYPLGFVVLFMCPVIWLRRALAARHASIQRALPFVLDLLTLSVEAGMDFMTALQRNNERCRVDALGEELIRVVREILLGKTRREALRDMAGRVNLLDLKSVVNALCQADELGVGIGAMLRIQSNQMRLRRFERAERLANQAPVKLLFPLVAFIFPAVFMILLGPTFAKLVKYLF
ncbi:MAG: type II secretion system F family protein [Verrucomicrobiota bacterium]|nr:type II secretion system F family protein [Verrucomicrobiota bacterium]